MTADAAMLETQDNVRGAFTQSVVFHVAVLGGLMVYAYWNANGPEFGAEDAGTAVVGIQAVDTIPLVSRGPENPVANDTKSEVPQEVAKPSPKEAPEPDPVDAIALLPKERTSKQPLVAKSRLPSFESAPNQLTSKSPQSVSSPLYSGPKGGSQIGASGDTTLGNRFPEYAAQIQEITRISWRVQDVDRSITNGPPVKIRFQLQKNGSVTNIQLVQRSNIPTLDLSVQNAVEDSHYPPLPAGFDRDSVSVEFTMVLKR